jgi:hypothetical protein
MFILHIDFNGWNGDFWESENRRQNDHSLVISWLDRLGCDSIGKEENYDYYYYLIGMKYSYYYSCSLTTSIKIIILIDNVLYDYWRILYVWILLNIFHNGLIHYYDYDCLNCLDCLDCLNDHDWNCLLSCYCWCWEGWGWVGSYFCFTNCGWILIETCSYSLLLHLWIVTSRLHHHCINKVSIRLLPSFDCLQWVYLLESLDFLKHCSNSIGSVCLLIFLVLVIMTLFHLCCNYLLIVSQLFDSMNVSLIVIVLLILFSILVLLFYYSILHVSILLNLLFIVILLFYSMIHYVLLIVFLFEFSFHSINLSIILF